MKSFLKKLELWWILKWNPSLKLSGIHTKECDKVNKQGLAVLCTKEQMQYAGKTYALTMLLEVIITHDGVGIDCAGFEWLCVDWPGNDTLPVNMTPDLDRKAELLMYIYLELLDAETAADIVHLCGFDIR